MAGIFTHWMIVESALLQLDRLPASRHLATLAARGGFVALGSIGPDYPYLAEAAAALPPARSWADRMHRERSGEFMVRGLRNLGALGGSDHELALAWLFGFATHLVADTIVHPVVNATVGGLAQFRGKEHHHCEMVQDCYLYRAVSGLEIPDGRYLEPLRSCSHPDDPDRLHPALAAFWTRALRDLYPEAKACFQDIDPDGWHGHVVRRARALADPAAADRAGADGDELRLARRRSSELSDEEVARFIREVKLPGGGTGNFQRDVFDKVVAQVIAVWGRLLADVEEGNPEGCRAYLRNWDLDRGVDADAAYFWR